MRATLAFAILAAVMYICGISDTTKPSTETAPSNAVSRAPAKPDKESVKRDLLKMEDEMANAGMNGDITYLARITTDDFKLTGVDGKVQDKNEALADVKKEKSIKAFSITDGDLMSFTDDSAVLTYKLNLTLKNGRSGSARITDSFVKQDGKWMLKSSQQTMISK
jgi:hypothetical protein